MNCILRGVRVVDPIGGIDTAGQDVWLSDGRIIAIYRQIDAGTLPVVDLTPAPGQQPCILSPAFIDLHAHLRQPGGEEAETVASGAAAAAAGGFGTVLAMANTTPPVDTPDRVEEACRLAAGAAVRVLVTAAVSRGLEGVTAVDVAGCVAAGASAFSDDGRNAAPAPLLQQVMKASATHGLSVLVHPEDESLIDAAPGRVTRCLDRPEIVEVTAVRTALDVLRAAGRGRLHLQHLSTATAVDLVREAREDGLAVTAEATPHHLAMWSPSAAPDPPALLKVNPPLRTESDRRAIVQALRDGVIDAVATDHAPHPMREKTGDLAAAAPGMTGLETALATCITLGAMDGDWIPVLVERLTAGPHRVLGTASGVAEPRLRVGELATFTLFDPGAEWVVGDDAPRSRSRNTPLWGVRLRGRVLLTMVGGTVAYRDGWRSRWPSTLVEAVHG
jgi:dihydroorotase